MSFPLSAMFDEMLEEVKVDWSTESGSGRVGVAGAGGWPVSPQSGRGAGPIPQPGVKTRHGGKKSAAQVFLTAAPPAPMQCCLLTISRSFLNSPILTFTIDLIRFLESILKDLIFISWVESYYALES